MPLIVIVLSAEGEGRGWNNHFFFLSSEFQQIVETPCTPKQDTICGCRKNQYQIGLADLFQCRNCSSCVNGIITSCEYGMDMVPVQSYCSRVDMNSPLFTFWHASAPCPEVIVDQLSVLPAPFPQEDCHFLPALVSIYVFCHSFYLPFVSSFLILALWVDTLYSILVPLPCIYCMSML